MQYFKSFWGLRPLHPHQGSALDPLGGGAHSAPPDPQLTWAMTCGNCISCLRHDTSPKTCHACIEIRLCFSNYRPAFFSSALENFYHRPGENTTQGTSARGVFCPKLLHDSAGLPYTKDRLLSCATKSLDRIAQTY